MTIRVWYRKSRKQSIRLKASTSVLESSLKKGHFQVKMLISIYSIYENTNCKRMVYTSSELLGVSQ